MATRRSSPCQASGHDSRLEAPDHMMSSVSRDARTNKCGKTTNLTRELSTVRKGMTPNFRQKKLLVSLRSAQCKVQGQQQAGLQAPKFSGQTEPSIHALDDALAMASRTIQALEFWKNKVIADQSAKQDQQEQQQNYPDETTPRTSKSRISKACNRCRDRKRRCNGESPCDKCREDNMPCEYVETQPTV